MLEPHSGKGTDVVEIVKREQIRRLLGIYETLGDLYQDAAWIMKRDLPAIDSLTEELWAEIVQGDRASISNQQGFDVRVREDGQRDQVKVRTATPQHPAPTFHIKMTNDEGLPAFDRVILIAVTVPFHVESALLIPHQTLVEQFHGKQTISKQPSGTWMGWDGVEDVTEVVRAAFDGLLAGR